MIKKFKDFFLKRKSAISGKKILIIGLVLVLFVLADVAAIVFLKNAKKTLTPDQAKITAENFINENLLPENIKATVKDVVLEGNVYKISLEVSSKEYTSYMTKDGTKFFESGIDMAELAAETAASKAKSENQNQASSANVPKTDKPKVELFVMTYCPYGLQAEKGILPALEALGDKIDAKIRFVHYFMHGDKEEQETYNQVCIREEQAEKFNSYLNCFVIEGDSAKCVKSAGVNEAKLKTCVAGKAKEYYKIDSDFSNGYNVEGSPTLVINGAQSNAGRSSASYLAGICAAFTNKPAECSKELSSASPSSSFGAGTDSGGSSASCQ